MSRFSISWIAILGLTIISLTKLKFAQLPRPAHRRSVSEGARRPPTDGFGVQSQQRNANPTHGARIGHSSFPQPPFIEPEARKDATSAKSQLIPGCTQEGILLARLQDHDGANLPQLCLQNLSEVLYGECSTPSSLTRLLRRGFHNAEPRLADTADSGVRKSLLKKAISATYSQLRNVNIMGRADFESLVHQAKQKMPKHPTMSILARAMVDARVKSVQLHHHSGAPEADPDYMAVVAVRQFHI